MERQSVTSEAREEGGAVRNVQVEEKQDERKGDRGKLESGSRAKEEWEHDGSRSVVPPRNHRRRRPLVWKNDSSVLTECPCFCLPLQSPLKPLRGWLRVDCGGWLPPRGWRNAGVGGVREGDEMPAPDSLIAAAQLCVPLWRSVKLSLSVAQPRHHPLASRLFSFYLSPFPCQASLLVPSAALSRGCCGPRCNDVSRI